MSTKHGHNIYDNEILDKFNYGSNRTATYLLNQITVSPFVHIYDIISLLAVELEEPKLGI